MRSYKPIKGRDIDGAHASSLDVRLAAADARRKRAAQGACLNSLDHGPATHGCRCKRCFAIYRYGLVVVLERGVDNLDLSDRRRFNKFPSAAHAA